MTRELNDKMEIDHVIRVDVNGEVSDTTGIYAPSLLDGELDGSEWSFFSAGYSGQYSYSGPIMHDSEYIGGGLEFDILSTPGVYAAVASYYSADPDGNECGDDEELYGEGWAVVRLDDEHDPDHVHQWGAVEISRLAGTPHRCCVVTGCNIISLDLSDDDE
jgi:hypothetical protein